MGKKYSDDEARKILLVAGLQPLVPYVSSASPWKSICLNCGKEVSPSLNSVQQRRTTCKYCSRNKSIEKNNKDGEDEAQKLIRSVGLEPIEDYPGAKKAWKCICTKCGNEVSPRLGNIRSGQGACGYCSGVRINPNNAIEDMLKMNLRPLVNFPGSKNKWKSECMKCGNIVYPYYTAVQQGRNSCVYCGGNRLTLKEIMETMTNAGYIPLEPYVKASTKWKSKCTNCGQISFPMYNSVQQGNKCGFCAGIRVDVSKAIETVQSRGLIPKANYPGADSPWECECSKCGNTVYPTYSSVKNGGGCRFCAKFGFTFGKPALLYLITNHELRAHKIGITNLKEGKENTRIQKHSLQGWAVYRVLELDNGEIAKKIENEILRWIRIDLGLGQFLSQNLMPQGERQRQWMP